MNHAEISRRLALAIGYRPEDAWDRRDCVFVWFDDAWEAFDHRDERTIFRIAARYKMFPSWFISTRSWAMNVGFSYVEHDCPATCIALAVIEASERGLLS